MPFLTIFLKKRFMYRKILIMYFPLFREFFVKDCLLLLLN